MGNSPEYRAKNREAILAYNKAYYGKQTIENRMITKAKVRARAQNVPFSITEADVMIPSHCPYLGIELKVGEGKFSPNSPSLDKIIPELGYVPGNVRVISFMANAMKQNATPEQLLAFRDGITRLHGAS